MKAYKWNALGLSGEYSNVIVVAESEEQARELIRKYDTDHTETLSQIMVDGPPITKDLPCVYWSEWGW